MERFPSYRERCYSINMVIALLKSFVNSVAINIFPFREIYVKPTSIFYYRVDNDGKTACFFKYKANRARRHKLYFVSTFTWRKFE